MRGVRKGNIKNNTIFWKNDSRKTEYIRVDLFSPDGYS